MRTQSRWTGMWLLAVLGAVVLLQAPLIFNPGYLSHDELQWAALAQARPGLASSAELWTRVQAFQYRPVTFGLWLWLSAHLFDHPQVFHGLMVAWGGLNAVLLARLTMRLGASAGAACVGALVFAMSPFAVQVHGWAGTLADLIWLSCALLVGLLVTRGGPRWVTFAGAAVLTAIGLLAKESAVVIPALAALGWWWLGRQRAWAIATAGALVPTAIYLSLRCGVILFSTRESANYDWSPSFVPLRWLEYQLFAPIVTRPEIGHLLPNGFAEPRVWISAALWLALAWTFRRAGVRWLWAFVLLGAVALGPVLILAESANHYAYGYAAATCALGAAAWSRIDRGGRAVLVLCALLSTWHGVNVMRRVHEIGLLQSRFSPTLAHTVATSSTYPVRVRAADPKQHAIYLRLSHEVPRYGGVDIGHRVQLVASDAPADYVIAPDGTVTR